MNNKPVTILAIESSCDETACAVVQKFPDEELVRVLSSTTATSLVKHKATKGIVPEVAAREQLKFILPVIQETLLGYNKTLVRANDSTKPNVDAIAVTTGPGLVGSLLVGIETARALASVWDLPIISVNHVKAHPYANFVYQETDTFQPDFPLLSWVISGGHTNLYLMNSHDDIQELGETVDDAAGECFDKCARVLGFDYPGGPFIEKLALNFTSIENPPKIDPLPRPLLHEADFRLSFSGLKSSFLRSFKENQSKIDSETLKVILAHELQEAISDVVVKKTQLALEKYPLVKSIIVSGGVAANKRIREKIEGLTTSRDELSIHFPPLSLCTDNADMIGAYALFHLEEQTSWKNVKLKL